MHFIKQKKMEETDTKFLKTKSYSTNISIIAVAFVLMKDDYLSPIVVLKVYERTLPSLLNFITKSLVSVSPIRRYV